MEWGRERVVALGSQTSGVTAEVAPAVVSAIPLESQNHLLPIAPAGAHKMQPAEGSQHKGCSVMSLTHPKSHQCSGWGTATPTPTAAWDGARRGGLQQTLGKINNRTARRTAFENGEFARQIYLCRQPTGHFLGFVHSHKLCGRARSYCIHNPEQLTLTSSHSRY